MEFGRPKALRTSGIDLASQKGVCSIRIGEKRPHARRERSGRTANSRAHAYSPIDSIGHFDLSDGRRYEAEARTVRRSVKNYVG